MKDKSLGFLLGVSSTVLAYAITKLDYKTSQWECNCCGINFKPPFKEYFWAMHTPKKRKLICPVCSAKDYFECKRDFKKALPKKMQTTKK
jgi:Zn finger protein HypA/HybF involved in hydrogenase expression